MTEEHKKTTPSCHALVDHSRWVGTLHTPDPWCEYHWLLFAGRDLPNNSTWSQICTVIMNIITNTFNANFVSLEVDSSEWVNTRHLDLTDKMTMRYSTESCVSWFGRQSFSSIDIVYKKLSCGIRLFSFYWLGCSGFVVKRDVSLLIDLWFNLCYLELPLQTVCESMNITCSLQTSQRDERTRKVCPTENCKHEKKVSELCINNKMGS